MALTVDLLNLPKSQSPISFARQAMSNYKDETGGFQGLFETEKSALTDDKELNSFALQFEHCTLSLDLIKDRKTKKEFLKGFNIYENLS